MLGQVLGIVIHAHDQFFLGEMPAVRAFQMDPNMNLSMPDARRLFDEMAENTKKYLGMYFN